MSRIRPWLAAVSALVVIPVVAVVGSASGSGASPAVSAPTSGLLFGAAEWTPTGRRIGDLETDLGRTMAIDRVYSQWDDVQPTSQVRDDVAVGRIPLVSIRPQRRNGTMLSWATVAAGNGDTVLRPRLRALAALGRPVLISFHHEADLASGYGTAAQFRAAFAHVAALVHSMGAATMSTVLILAANTYRPAAIGSWYPGDAAVDWAGADAYNFAGCRSGLPPWRSFAAAVAPFRQWGATHAKPQVLAEWGTVERAGVTGGKADWITAAGSTMRAWPQLHAAAYFDQSGTCNWRLNTSASALSAFRTLARSVYANGHPTARLTAAVSGTSVRFGLGDSTGSAHITGHGVTSWSFDPGDGAAVAHGTGTPGSVTHRYAAGSHTATLTVRDATGRSATTHRAVRVG